jgi:hypothetical protein
MSYAPAGMSFNFHFLQAAALKSQEAHALLTADQHSPTE